MVVNIIELRLDIAVNPFPAVTPLKQPAHQPLANLSPVGVLFHLIHQLLGHAAHRGEGSVHLVLGQLGQEARLGGGRDPGGAGPGQRPLTTYRPPTGEGPVGVRRELGVSE